jgi:hypothetical protein
MLVWPYYLRIFFYLFCRFNDFVGNDNVKKVNDNSNDNNNGLNELTDEYVKECNLSNAVLFLGKSLNAIKLNITKKSNSCFVIIVLIFQRIFERWLYFSSRSIYIKNK